MLPSVYIHKQRDILCEAFWKETLYMNAKIKDWTAIILGNTINAFAVALFILPNGLAMGGSTGIALTVNHFFNIFLYLYLI